MVPGFATQECGDATENKTQTKFREELAAAEGVTFSRRYCNAQRNDRAYRECGRQASQPVPGSPFSLGLLVVCRSQSVRTNNV